MPINNKTISRQQAEANNHFGEAYEGYVEGEGYQFPVAHFFTSGYFQESGFCVPAFETAWIDSPDAKMQSLNITTEHLQKRLIKIKDGSALLNMGHGRMVQLSDNCEIVLKLDDKMQFTFGYSDKVTGKEEIIQDNLHNFDSRFGDGLLMGDITRPGEAPYMQSDSYSLGSPVFGQLGYAALAASTKTIFRVVDNEYIRQVNFNNTLLKPGDVKEVPVPMKVPKFLKFAGKYGGFIFSAWGAVDIYSQYETGSIEESKMWKEQGSNAIGVLPVIGTGWTVGWEAGRAICSSSGYQRFKYKVWKSYYEWRMGGSIDENPVLWNHFHRLYKP